MKRRRWQTGELDTLRRMYADVRTEEIAVELGRTLRQVYLAAARLGLKKSAAYLASPAAYRMRRGNPTSSASSLAAIRMNMWAVEDGFRVMYGPWEGDGRRLHLEPAPTDGEAA